MVDLSKIEREKLKRIMDDPVLWAKAFIKIHDPVSKKEVPWTARWYQAEMLRDNAIRKVSRCGRRTGKTEAMCVEMLHKIYRNKKFTVLVVTPYENQVELIFKRLNEMIDGSDLLKPMRTRNVKSPYRLGFSNGSVIFGFTTGASSNSGAASLRGQKADLIVMDEVDKQHIVHYKLR